MKLLDPKLTILDETDSGLDIDALRIVADGVNSHKNNDNAFLSLLIIKDYLITSNQILFMYYPKVKLSKLDHLN